MKNLIFCCVFFAILSAAHAQEVPYGNSLTAENDYEGDPKLMMKSFLLGETAKAKKSWTERYETIKTVEDVEKYQAERKTFLKERLGEMWDRDTPLNPKVLKTLENGTPGKDAYKVEMVVFESVPNFFVSGAVFVPDPTRFKPPYPAVLVVLGHSDTGKSYELYQRVPALAASNGLLAMSIDPIDQGERSQRLTEDGKPKAQSVAAHNIIGAGSVLLGRNAATFEVWDMIRAVDYLQSRPDVIADKIGVTGTSGGGTQTSYIMSLDDRIAAAVPSCYLCSLYELGGKLGPQDAEQNIFGQLAFGLDHADYCIIRAPKPTLIESVTQDFFPIEDTWPAFRAAKRIFDRFGYAEKMSIIEHDAKHGWQKNLREASIRWMLRWLAGRDEQIFEAADMPVFPVEQFKGTPRGEVLLLDGARSAYDLNRDYNEELLAVRKEKNEKRSRGDFCEIVRKTAGIRSLADISAYEVGNRTAIEIPQPLAETASKVERFTLKTEEGRIVLPALLFSPKTEEKAEPKELSVFLHEKGKSADLSGIAESLKAGSIVLAVDLRGLGETQAVGPQYYRHDMFGTDGTDYYLGYLLGKSYVGMRTEDLLAAARWFAESHGKGKVEIVAEGETVGMVALHAAALEPSLVSRCVLKKPIRSWHEVVQAGDSFYPITNLVHGALREYDVPELMKFGGAE